MYRYIPFYLPVRKGADVARSNSAHEPQKVVVDYQALTHFEVHGQNCCVARGDEGGACPYGMKPSEDILAFLLKLSGELADKEKNGAPVIPPGLPATIEKPEQFVTGDCVQPA